MAININRFYKREQWQLDCEIVTPMFLGNAKQEAELRSAPFKGLLRYWWRVANGWKYTTDVELLKAESEVFGSPDDTGGKSQVAVEVMALSSFVPLQNDFRSQGKIAHPECERSNNQTEPLNYLAGMGLIHFRTGVIHSYFAPGEKFKITIQASAEHLESVQSALYLLGMFGAIGSRSRNGWGCFCIDKLPVNHGCFLRIFTENFDRDYPHCLGNDSKGALFWGTKITRETWEKSMKDLAEIYVAIRAGNDSWNIPKLDVNKGNPPDRHLLGYPVTNHSINRENWGKQGRHASALRLMVRKESDGHRGYILHLPHLFSKEMWPNGKDRQIEIWKRVHANLDKLCQRVELQEAQV